MGPDTVRLAIVGFALSGIEHEHIVYIAVVVHIIVSEIDFAVKTLTRFIDHHLRILVLPPIGVVATIVATVFRECERAVDVKLRIKLSVGVFEEVVVGRTGSAILAETFFHQKILEIGFGIGHGEFHILVLDKDHQTAHFARAGEVT